VAISFSSRLVGHREGPGCYQCDRDSHGEHVPPAEEQVEVAAARRAADDREVEEPGAVHFVSVPPRRRGEQRSEAHPLPRVGLDRSMKQHKSAVTQPTSYMSISALGALSATSTEVGMSMAHSRGTDIFAVRATATSGRRPPLLRHCEGTRADRR